MSVCNICNQLVAQVKPIESELKCILENLRIQLNNRTDGAAVDPLPTRWICDTCDVSVRNRYILRNQEESPTCMQLENEKPTNTVNQIQQDDIKKPILLDIKEETKDSMELVDATDEAMLPNGFIIYEISEGQKVNEYILPVNSSALMPDQSITLNKAEFKTEPDDNMILLNDIERFDAGNQNTSEKPNSSVTVSESDSLNQPQSSSQRTKPIKYNTFYRKVADNFYCLLCKTSKKYTYCGGVIYHIRTSHLGVKYKCSDCDSIFESLYFYQTHYDSQHNTSSETVQTPSSKRKSSKIVQSSERQSFQSLIRKCGKLYLCNTCAEAGKSYTSKYFESLRRHIKTHHVEAYLEQQQKKQQLQRQKTTVNDFCCFQRLMRKSGDLYMCNTCAENGKSYTNKYGANMRRHIKTYHLEAYQEQQQQKKQQNSASGPISSGIEIKQKEQQLIAEDISAVTYVVNDVIKEENKLTEYIFNEQQNSVLTEKTTTLKEFYFPPLTTCEQSGQNVSEKESCSMAIENIAANSEDVNDKASDISYCSNSDYSGHNNQYLTANELDQHQEISTPSSSPKDQQLPVHNSLISAQTLLKRRHNFAQFCKKIDRTFHCKLCSRNFNQLRYMKDHYISCHLKMKYTCTVCSFKYVDFRTLLQHYTREHSEITPPSSRNTAMMSYSNVHQTKRSRYNWTYRKHGKKFVCSLCPTDADTIKYNSNKSIINHIKEFHSKQLKVQNTNEPAAENGAAAIKLQIAGGPTEHTASSPNCKAIKTGQKVNSKETSSDNYSEIMQAKAISLCADPIFGKELNADKLSDVDNTMQSIESTEDYQQENEETAIVAAARPIKRQSRFYNMPIKKVNNLFVCMLCRPSENPYSNEKQAVLVRHINTDHYGQFNCTDCGKVFFTNYSLKRHRARICARPKKGDYSKAGKDNKKIQTNSDKTAVTSITANQSVSADKLVCKAEPSTDANSNADNDNKKMPAVCTNTAAVTSITADRIASDEPKSDNLIYKAIDKISVPLKQTANEKTVTATVNSMPYKKVDKLFVCTLCRSLDGGEMPFSAKYYEAIVRHINKVHYVKFQCESCDKVFVSQYSLTRHKTSKIACDTRNISVNHQKETEPKTVPLTEYQTFKQESNDNRYPVQEILVNNSNSLDSMVFIKEEPQLTEYNYDRKNAADELTLGQEENVAGLHKDERSVDNSGSIKDQLSKFTKEEQQLTEYNYDQKNVNDELTLGQDENVAGLQNDERSVDNSGSIKDQLSKFNHNFKQNLSKSSKHDVQDRLTENAKMSQSTASLAATEFTSNKMTSVAQDYVANYEKINGKYLCSPCSGQGIINYFYNKRCMLKHLKRKHSDKDKRSYGTHKTSVTRLNSKHKCQDCGLVFTRNFSLERHRKTCIHSETYLTSEKNQNHDSSSRKITKSVSVKTFQSHDETLANYKPDFKLFFKKVNGTYHCLKCPKIYNRWGSPIYHHIKSTHMGIRYACAICSTTYFKIPDWRSHYKRQHPEIEPPDINTALQIIATTEEEGVVNEEKI